MINGPAARRMGRCHPGLAGPPVGRSRNHDRQKKCDEKTPNLLWNQMYGDHIVVTSVCGNPDWPVGLLDFSAFPSIEGTFFAASWIQMIRYW